MNLMWIFIMLGTILLSILSFGYLINRITKFHIINKLSSGRKSVKLLLSLLIIIIVIIFLYYAFNYVNLCVILIHLTVFWLLSDLLIFILSKKISILSNMKIYTAGVIALAFTFIYLSCAFYNDRHVVVTEYNITTEKDVEPLKIVQFSDSHLGTTFDGEGLKKHINKINDLKPDLVVITGDFIDGWSNSSDIIDGVKALSLLNSTYGTYFVFGNHDKNYYGEEGKRTFSTEDLINELTDNNVTILEDEIVSIPGGYTLIGRQDRQEDSRASIYELMEKVDTDTFSIDLNHQPNDYTNEASAFVDLVLSGHTHGGQLFPIINAGIWMGANDKTYGYEKRGNTNFIVSSGISDWAIDFKTGCKSEIVLININKQP